ncbi:hypothetical protein ASZ90_009837 [hydrocarbon metagenome]|uniref:Uncharacterized protein n=1 Tax=hydrocarbon metagenome TaxID=938273 RepID=A0A0W8FI78_9ZZZZ
MRIPDLTLLMVKNPYINVLVQRPEMAAIRRPITVQSSPEA